MGDQSGNNEILLRCYMPVAVSTFDGHRCDPQRYSRRKRKRKLGESRRTEATFETAVRSDIEIGSQQFSALRSTTWTVTVRASERPFRVRKRCAIKTSPRRLRSFVGYDPTDSGGPFNLQRGP